VLVEVRHCHDSAKSECLRDGLSLGLPTGGRVQGCVMCKLVGFDVSMGRS
jgi:hypothetical protein